MRPLFDILDALDASTVIFAAGLLMLVVTVIDRHIQEG